MIGGGLTRSLRVWGRKGKWVDFGGASRACQPRLQSPAVYLAQHSMVTVADTHREFRIWHQISYQDLSDRIDPGQRWTAGVFSTRLPVVTLIL